MVFERKHASQLVEVRAGLLSTSTRVREWGPPRLHPGSRAYLLRGVPRSRRRRLRWGLRSGLVSTMSGPVLHSIPALDTESSTTFRISRQGLTDVSHSMTSQSRPQARQLIQGARLGRSSQGVRAKRRITPRAASSVGSGPWLSQWRWSSTEYTGSDDRPLPRRHGHGSPRPRRVVLTGRRVLQDLQRDVVAMAAAHAVLEIMLALLAMSSRPPSRPTTADPSGGDR